MPPGQILNSVAIYKCINLGLWLAIVEQFLFVQKIQETSTSSAYS